MKLFFTRYFKCTKIFFLLENLRYFKVFHKSNFKGIPDKYRGEIWMVYSGAINEMANHQGYYQSLVDQCMGKDTLATDEIGCFILLITIRKKS